MLNAMRGTLASSDCFPNLGGVSAAVRTTEGDASYVTSDADVTAVASTASISASASFGIYRFVFFQPRGSSGFLVNV
jgi:hypothetical protein